MSDAHRVRVWVMTPDVPEIHTRRIYASEATLSNLVGCQSMFEIMIRSSTGKGNYRILMVPDEDAGACAPNRCAQRLFKRVWFPPMPNGEPRRFLGPVVVAHMGYDGTFLDMDHTPASFAAHAARCIRQPQPDAPPLPTRYAYAFYKGTLVPTTIEDYHTLCKDATAMLEAELRNGARAIDLIARYIGQLDALEKKLVDTSKTSIRYADAWGPDYPKAMESWCLNVQALLVLGAIPNDDRNGWMLTSHDITDRSRPRQSGCMVAFR